MAEPHQHIWSHPCKASPVDWVGWLQSGFWYCTEDPLSLRWAYRGGRLRSPGRSRSLPAEILSFHLWHIPWFTVAANTPQSLFLRNGVLLHRLGAFLP